MRVLLVLPHVGQKPALVPAHVARVPLVSVQHHVGLEVLAAVADLVAERALELLETWQLLAVLLEHVGKVEVAGDELAPAVRADLLKAEEPPLAVGPACERQNRQTW